MSGITSTTSYDYNTLEIVSVIASFDTDGQVKPLYVRINQESLKVHSSWIKPSFQGFIEFQCKVIDNGCLKPLALSYHKNENVWLTPKFNCVRSQ